MGVAETCSMKEKNRARVLDSVLTGTNGSEFTLDAVKPVIQYIKHFSTA